MSRNQELTYGTEVESYRLDINTKERTITFSSPVFSFIIHAETVAIQYEINGVTGANSMVLPAGQRERRNVLTSTIAVRSIANDGAVYVSGIR